MAVRHRGVVTKEVQSQKGNGLRRRVIDAGSKAILIQRYGVTVDV